MDAVVITAMEAEQAEWEETAVPMACTAPGCDEEWFSGERDGELLDQYCPCGAEGIPTT